MNSRRKRFLALAGLAALCASMFFVYHKSQSPAHLEIAGRTIEHDRPVVHFKIAGTGKGLLQIEALYLVDGTNVPIRLVRATNGLYGCWADIWPEIIDPIDDANRHQPEFSMIEPTNRIWRLKTELILEDRSLFTRLRTMLEGWKSIGKGKALSAWRVLKNVHSFEIKSIESEPITNVVTHEVSSQM